MSRNRILARLFAGLTATAALAAVAVPAMADGDPARPAPETRTAADRTTVTFEVAGCEGCTLRLLQADRHYEDVWSSKQRTVRDGEATWRVPSDRARHFVVAITAPWEGRTGYQGMVVAHYRGIAADEQVGVATARGKSHGAFCFPGTDDGSYTVRLTVRKVKVEGTRPHRVNGTLAFASTSTPFDRPMQRIFEGVGGAQDVPFCAKA